MTARAATRFSFILSIPAVAGGTFLEMVKSSSHASIAWDQCFIGLGVSACVGLGIIRIAIPLLEKGAFKPFAWYCLIVSILLMV
jgi:undecaprenyl-diphosphatase